MARNGGRLIGPALALLDTLMERLAIEQAILVEDSRGGRLDRQFAARLLQRVEKRVEKRGRHVEMRGTAVGKGAIRAQSGRDQATFGDRSERLRSRTFGKMGGQGAG